MKYAQQTVSFTIDCSASIEAKGEITDYGVPGSPRWIEYEPQYWGSSTIEIAGVDVKIVDLPVELGKALWELATEAAEDCDWRY